MLKLQPLPKRAPFKLTITLPPDVKIALDDYAALYERTYGVQEPVAELIPFMLDGFLKADIGFKKGRKELNVVPLSFPLAKKKGKQKHNSEKINDEVES